MINKREDSRGNRRRAESAWSKLVPGEKRKPFERAERRLADQSARRLPRRKCLRLLSAVTLGKSASVSLARCQRRAWSSITPTPGNCS